MRVTPPPLPAGPALLTPPTPISGCVPTAIAACWQLFAPLPIAWLLLPLCPAGCHTRAFNRTGPGPRERIGGLNWLQDTYPHMTLGGKTPARSLEARHSKSAAAPARHAAGPRRAAGAGGAAVMGRRCSRARAKAAASAGDNVQGQRPWRKQPAGMLTPPKSTLAGIWQAGATAWPGITTALLRSGRGGGGRARGGAGVSTAVYTCQCRWGGGGGAARRSCAWYATHACTQAGCDMPLETLHSGSAAAPRAPRRGPRLNMVVPQGSARCSWSAAMGFLPVVWAAITKPGGRGRVGWVPVSQPSWTGAIGALTARHCYVLIACHQQCGTLLPLGPGAANSAPVAHR